MNTLLDWQADIMKKTIYAIAFVLLGIGVVGDAMADRRVHSHVGVGVVIGGPVWSPWYYPYPPPYYYPPVVIERAPPPVYIEQAPAATAPQTNYWYYCREARGYYPYVKECPGGWQKILPRPSDQP